jgi:signal transduction histidine kinase
MYDAGLECVEMTPTPARAAGSATASSHETGRTPSVRLALGLGLSLLTILGVCLYAAHEIAVLRDEQMAVSERHRRDSLELLRIQSNLSTLAVSLRDMMEQPPASGDRVPDRERLPDRDRLIAWQNTLSGLRADLTQAIELERTLAPLRPAGQQQELTDTADRLWGAIDRAFTLFLHRDPAGATEVIRSSAFPRHAELAASVAQFLIRNTQVEEDAAAAARGVYTRVAREIYLLMAILLAAVAITGVLNIVSTRRAFNDVKELSAQLRALTWRMLRLQEDMQTSMARELHDEFGQILTAMNMLVGRAKRQLEAAATARARTVDADTDTDTDTDTDADAHADAGAGVAAGSVAAVAAADADDPTEMALRRLVTNVEEVQGIAQQTLERIRTASRLLHPVILDDFGLEQAIAWYVDQFSRQHGIETQFVRTGTIGYVAPDASIHLYRIVQEALSNVSRHSGAARAWVRLGQADRTLALDIEDSGRASAAAASTTTAAAETPERRGIGMTSMRERAELMGGELTIGRAASGGLIVSVRVPLARVTADPAASPAPAAGPVTSTGAAAGAATATAATTSPSPDPRDERGVLRVG